jgi:hypothetical protein
MEQFKRNKILLVAFVLGIMGLIAWGCVLYGGTMVQKKAFDSTQRQYNQEFGAQERKFSASSAVFAPGALALIFGSITVILAAVVFNFFAWKNDSKKQKIIAGILYVLGIFSIISAILCFISLKEKKMLET